MEQSNEPTTVERPTRRAYVLGAAVLVYNAVMVFVSCFYHTSIMNPWQLLWGFCFLIGSPAIVIAALVRLARLLARSRLTPLRTLLPVVAIVSVVIWWQGIFSIGAYARPRLFALVAADNEQRALTAIRTMDDPNRVYVSGFRYPYCRMSTFGRYEDGALFLVVPSAPGPKDTILFDPNDAVPKEGWEHLYGPWHYRYASQ